MLFPSVSLLALTALLCIAHFELNAFAAPVPCQGCNFGVMDKEAVVPPASRTTTTLEDSDSVVGPTGVHVDCVGCAPSLTSTSESTPSFTEHTILGTAYSDSVVVPTSVSIHDDSCPGCVLPSTTSVPEGMRDFIPDASPIATTSARSVVGRIAVDVEELCAGCVLPSSAAVSEKMLMRRQ